MTPVISPWVFYLMSVADNIGVASFILAVIVGSAAIGNGIITAIDRELLDKEELATATKRGKKLVVVALARLRLLKSGLRVIIEDVRIANNG